MHWKNVLYFTFITVIHMKFKTNIKYGHIKIVSKLLT